MKKLMLIIICLVFSSQVLQSQEIKDIFTSKEATWYGLDFSKVKLIGSEGFTDALKIKNVFFPSWNNLIINEPAKYNLQLMFHKDTVFFDLSVIDKRNKLPYALDKNTIAEIIKEYNSKEKEGLGIVFIMESLDKPKRIATMWVTFFDIASKTVLLTEKMSGKPGGAGFRNYWARTYYNVMAKIKKTEYLKWEKEYNK
jgi:hypothetical protein